jgi:hypothetical protein
MGTDTAAEDAPAVQAQPPRRYGFGGAPLTFGMAAIAGYGLRPPLIASARA